MKKNILLLFTPLCFFAQEKATTNSGKVVLLNNDYTWKYDDQQSNIFSDELLLKNRSSEVVDMSKYFLSTGNVETENFDGSKIEIQYQLLIDLSVYELIKDKSIFNKITRHVINDASYKVKNKYTFKPRKIQFFVQDNNTFRILLEYSAENDYGATKTGNFGGSEYDFNGNFIKNDYEDKLKEIYGK